MKRPLRWRDLLTVNAFWLGANVGSGILTPVLLPFLVALFMPAAQKNSYLATVRVIGLAVAMLVQPLAGLLSDRNTSRWGRRRPFIATGALFNIVFLSIIGASPSFLGPAHAGVSAAYLVLIIGVALLQVSANVAQGALQGLIPDIVPDNQRGKASGVKSVFELLPIFVVIFIGPLVDAGKIWLVIGIMMAAYAITAAINVLGVHETPLREKPAGSLLGPILRLVALTAIFVGTTQAVVWLIKAAGRWLREDGVAPAAQVGLLGIIGLAGMAGAIFIGVYGGASVGIGSEARQQKSFIWWVINRLLFLAAIGG
jgi:Na+/melibiose symporter-like transporter